MPYAIKSNTIKEINTFKKVNITEAQGWSKAGKEMQID